MSPPRNKAANHVSNVYGIANAGNSVLRVQIVINGPSITSATRRISQKISLVIKIHNQYVEHFHKNKVAG